MIQIQNNSSNNTGSVVSHITMAESSDHVIVLLSPRSRDRVPLEKNSCLSVVPCKVFDNLIPRFYDNIAMNTYTVLHPDQYYYSSTHRVTNNIELYFNGWISKIILDDFPTTGQYTLSINGQNQCTAKLMEDRGIFKPVFDLAANIRSNLSKNIRKACNTGIPEEIQDKCYNFNRVDRCVINVSSGTEILKQHKITTEYFEINNNDIITKMVDQHDIYPRDTHLMSFSGPTYALTIYSDRRMEFLLMIENRIFGKFISDNDIYLRLEGSEHYRGNHNLHLSPDQQHSLNLSRVNNLRLIVLNENNDDHNDNGRPINFHVGTLSYVTYEKNHIVRIFAT